ncbi:MULTISPECIES: acyl-CoA dehydrogenase [unclassified Gordonia (in: high G+C Gram-positive bacteria)]|uniref:acyl-CoA dehydrogenase n=1 Tax=unclassified Gordonia (in: high G+C Gram-positive bacteria) TaxID=2657482 RepID=UPI00071C43C2|nr:MULTISPECIES: acyl-CoA dehydrogenase [unclassified Gordonia (in: high G+C Gram-positive bacteria)]KSU57902.1 acyl-CoA dehydrogenase [Gordonia sp. SGD-V-85]SCC29777.1 butyryl-CoA dehydrogenase [Gordonia sp. v-85]
MTTPMSRRDLEFLLYEWLDVETLTSRERFSAHSRETFDAVLELSADIAMKCFAPANKIGDANEPYIGDDGKVVLPDEIVAGLTEYRKAGLISASFDDELGGMQLPTVIRQASAVWFQAANAAMSSYNFLTVGNANLLAEYATPEQRDTWVRPLVEGRFSGTMCLSEPQAGSSLADITTKAEPAGDGTYRITGTKMWISGGDHELTENIVHLVLAKIPGGGPGVKGISLFIVPKYLADGTRNDVALVGLNHKMGNRATTNTLLNFGDGTFGADSTQTAPGAVDDQPARSAPGAVDDQPARSAPGAVDDQPARSAPGAVGYLVGDEHRGLSYMFHMMNEARIGVGFLATALGYAGYRASLDYAKVRTQGRPVDHKDPSTKPVPIIEHADVRRMLLAQKSYVEGSLAFGLYCSTLVDEAATTTDPAERDRLNLLLEVLTPIAKSWPSQWCLEANSLAIQVHGGYGYTREFDVEQYYRDNRLNPIHEGAHGIHGLDLLGRKVIMQGGAGLAALAETIEATVARARTVDGLDTLADTLHAVVDRLVKVTAHIWSAGDPKLSLANATIYLETAGHIVIAWIWLEQLLAADGRTGDFYDGKRAAAQYFFRYELPKTGPQLDLLTALDRTTLDVEPSWF